MLQNLPQPLGLTAGQLHGHLYLLATLCFIAPTMTVYCYIFSFLKNLLLPFITVVRDLYLLENSSTWYPLESLFVNEHD